MNQIQRDTPFDLAFPDPKRNHESFAAIREEAEHRKVDLSDAGAFLLLAQVGREVQEMAGEEEEELPASQRVRSFGPLLFHAFHFDASGRSVLGVESADLAQLRDPEGASSDGSAELPSGSGYLQLPLRRVWVRPEGGEGPAEDVDGIFWVCPADEGRDLHLLVISGIRADRPGFSVLPLPPISRLEAIAWRDRQARTEGQDFQSTLPGGELGGLLSLETPGEVVKLWVWALTVFQTGG